MSKENEYVKDGITITILGRGNVFHKRNEKESYVIAAGYPYEFASSDKKEVLQYLLDLSKKDQNEIDDLELDKEKPHYTEEQAVEFASGLRASSSAPEAFDSLIQLLAHRRRESDSIYYLKKRNKVFIECIEWFLENTKDG